MTATGSGPAPAPLLDVRDLVVDYRDPLHRTRRHRALDGISLSVQPDETVAIVGESGAGKSTLGRAILGLVPVRSGSITFEGADITNAGYRQRSRLAARLSAVFQDPYSSLNPARTIGDTLVEPLLVHDSLPRSELHGRMVAMLERVGMPASAIDRYPRQFSGGQRQRIAIARALMTSPRLVICDEPLSALDLSVQAQIINLFLGLCRQSSLSLLFIGHDLNVVRHLAQQVVVLRSGSVVEAGPATVVCSEPADAYTRALLASAPVPDPRTERARLAARMERQSAPDRLASESSRG
jgi:ABC-type glutathione transport system ATPase component